MVLRRFSVLILTAFLAFTIAAPTAAQDTGGIRGTVVDKDGEPLSGATVSVTNPGLSIDMGGLTNAEGEFRIARLPPGKGYILRVSFPTMSKISVPDIELWANKLIAVPITLRPRGEMICRGVRATNLETAAPKEDQVSSGILGGVVDLDGQPIVGVIVSVTHPTLGITTGGLTDALGEFRIAPLPPDKGYTLTVSVPQMERISMSDLEVPANKMRAIAITLRPAS